MELAALVMDERARYEIVRDIGSGNSGIAKLMRDKETTELFAVKCIQRGDKIDENVQREIINHRPLKHPNIIRFKEVFLTPTHLAIVMEYASGGELFDRINNAGRFSEDEARFFFQQLISGVSYCHSMQVCHRDLKLENTLLDGSGSPRLKICDFGYSKIADVWSCGVTLYVMLVGAYPFESSEPKNLRKTIQRIANVQYSIPDCLHISPECQHLISRIFVTDPATRITIPEIRKNQWFLKNLLADMMDDCEEPDQPIQSIDEIMQIIAEATVPAAGSHTLEEYMTGSLDLDDEMEGSDSEIDADSSGELVHAM